MVEKEVIFKLFKDGSRGKEGMTPLKVADPQLVEEGQLRLYTTPYPEYLLIVKKENSLITFIPLTNCISLLPAKPPVIEFPLEAKELNLKRYYRVAPAPFWMFADEEDVKNFSKPLLKLPPKAVELIKNYAVKTRIPENTLEEKFCLALADKLFPLTAKVFLDA